MHGFTLLELTVTLALLMLVSGLVASTLGPWLVFQQRIDTEERLLTLRGRWEELLDHFALPIEAQTLRPALSLGPIELQDGQSLAEPAVREGLASLFGEAGGAVFEDGFHQGWTLRVSRGLISEESGVTLHYHVLAILSAGPNGHLDTGTRFDPETGALAVAGDDRGIRIDGLPRARRRLLALQAKLERAAGAWQAWFQTRYEGDAERDASVDYFSGPCPGAALTLAWDSAPDALPNGCGSAVSGTVLAAQLGLGPADIDDESGGTLLFDSASVFTRNPAQPDPTRQAPPYSAAVIGSLPGSETVQRIVLGVL